MQGMQRRLFDYCLIFLSSYLLKTSNVLCEAHKFRFYFYYYFHFNFRKLNKEST